MAGLPAPVTDSGHFVFFEGETALLDSGPGTGKHSVKDQIANILEFVGPYVTITELGCRS